MMVVAFIMLLIPSIRKDYGKLKIAAVLAFVGIWIEKGMGLMIPGSIPTPIGEFTQYSPTLLEIFNSLGTWAIGFIVMTILLKGAIGVILGDISYANK